MLRNYKAVLDYRQAHLDINKMKAKVDAIRRNRQAAERAEQGGPVGELSSRAASHIAEYGTKSTPRRRR